GTSAAAAGAAAPRGNRMRPTLHNSSSPPVAGFTRTSHTAIHAIGSSSPPPPIALPRHRHDRDPPARSRDLSQAITRQTMLKIVTTNPIAASGPGQPRPWRLLIPSFVAHLRVWAPPYPRWREPVPPP